MFEKQLDARLLLENLKRIINQVAQNWSAIVRQASVNLVNCNLFFHTVFILVTDWDAQCALMWKEFQYLMSVSRIYLYSIMLNSHC